MKKILIPVILFTITLSLFAQLESFVSVRDMSDIGKPTRKASHPVSRTQTFEWELALDPIIANSASYYDYMVGTYLSTPFHKQPDDIGGGYYYSYMGRASDNPSTHARAYYGYLNNQNSVQYDDTFGSINRLEWFPDSVVDKNGKMLISYHSDSDGDGDYEQHYGYDSFFVNIPGIPSDEFDVFDNPITFNGHEDNKFTWAQIRVGESPLGDPYQRVYILGRNRVSHSVVDPETGNAKPVENPYIAFADYLSEDLEFGNLLTWTYTSIPTIDAWNVDTNEWRRPYYSFYVGEGDLAGKLYYMGYHLGDLADDEPDFDVFIHDDYGNTETAWRQVSIDTDFPLVNPVNANGDYLFVDAENNDQPYDIYWGIVNTGHFNISVDNENRLHMPVTYCINSTDDSYFYYFHNVKDVIFNPATESFDIVDVFPQSSTPGALFNPWDQDGDGAVDAYWDDGAYDGVDDGVGPDEEGYGNIKTNTIWPFMHWDKDSHETSMFFQLNLLRVTNANEEGVMAMMWHDSNAAVDFNVSSLTYWEPYAAKSELYITVSGDNGNTWEPPVALSSVDVANDFWYTDDGEFLGFDETHTYVPQWAGMHPQNVTPCPDILPIETMADGSQRHRMYMYFYDDAEWGSAEHGEGAWASGQVVINAIDFILPQSVSNDDHVNNVPNVMDVNNYPNPFNPQTNIAYSIKNSGDVKLSIYNVKGQKVETLVNESQTAGNHTVVWDAGSSASGVYFMRLESGNSVITRKMMMIK